MRKAWSVAPGPLRPDIVAAVEAELQKTTPERRARDANELAAILDDLGDLTREEIAERVVADADGLMASLEAERRIAPVQFGGGRRAWIPATDATLYAGLATEAGLERLALRVLRTRGPVTADWLAGRYGLTAAEVRPALDRLVARGVVRTGEFVTELGAAQFVHVAVLDEIQRRQVHARRIPRPVATAERFSAFLLRRHHLHPEHKLVGPPGVLAALELLQGEDFPVRVWEQDLLSARVEDYQREWLDRLGLSGEIVWTVFETTDRAKPPSDSPGRPKGATPPSDSPGRAKGASAGRVGVGLRDNIGWLRESAERAELDPRIKNVLLHLQLRGASFARDLARVAGLDPAQTLAALWDLFRTGLASPDTFSAIVAATAAPRPRAERPVMRRRPRRGQARGPLALLPPVGRWSVLAEDEPLSPEERDEARAHLLLARYGVVARELAQGDWSTLRHVLLRMEYGGEVVRGYFVEGLSGEQYALEETLAELTAPGTRRAEPHVLVNLVDPANLWGRVWPLSRRDGSRLSVARLPHVWLLLRAGRPVLLAESYGRELTPLAGFELVDLPGAVRALQAMLDRPLTLRPVRRLEVLGWEGRPIRETDAFAAFVDAGFSADGSRLSWDGYPGPRLPR
jgi:ATP-dependent Lhr-like helicase